MKEDKVVFTPKMVQEYRKAISESHEHYSQVIQRAMLLLLTVAMFCMVISLSSPDSALLGAEANIKVPFADAPISFLGFMVVGPFLLTLIVVYLHVFYGFWLELERDRQQLNHDGSEEAYIQSIPTVFSLDHPVPRLLTGFTFYWLVPVVLATIALKGAPLPERVLPLSLITGLVTFVLIFLRIRRCPLSKRKWQNQLRWVMLALVISLMVSVPLEPEWFHRPLILFRTNLSEIWLPNADLRFADARFANLQKANLSETKLQGADLHEAKLSGAILRGADLQGADLRWTDLSGTDLRRAELLSNGLLIEVKLHEAKLSNATLFGADLRGADLRGADLSGTYLIEVKLHEAKLRGANLSEAELIEATVHEAMLLGGDLRAAKRRWNQLYGAQLSGANLSEADLRRADLQGADLREAKLHEAKLSGANLSEAVLSGTDLSGNDLQGANLYGANLRGADLRGAKR